LYSCNQNMHTKHRIVGIALEIYGILKSVVLWYRLRCKMEEKWETIRSVL
jgi:hypothetical protein